MLSSRLLKLNKYSLFFNKTQFHKSFCKTIKQAKIAKKITKTSKITKSLDSKESNPQASQKNENISFKSNSTISNNKNDRLENKNESSTKVEPNKNSNTIEQQNNEKGNKNSWQRFFTSSSKVYPNFNRAIKNSPDDEFFEFYDDMKNHLNERQYLFLIKNLYINRSTSFNKDYANKLNDIVKNLVSNYLNENAINFNSKVNLMMFLECLYLNTLKFQQISLLDTLQKATDYLRIFFKNFSFEEKVFTLISIGKMGNFDFYLSNELLNQNYNLFLTNFDNNYMINYFKIPVRMDLGIINVLARHIIFYQSSKQQFIEEKFKTLVKQILEKVHNQMINNKITVSDLSEEYKNLTKLFSVLEDKEGQELEIKFNNLILEKVTAELSNYIEHNILNRDIVLFNSLSQILKEMKIDHYNPSLFHKCFQELSFILIQSFKKENYEMLGNLKSEIKDDFYETTVDFYKYIVKDLCQVSHDHNIFNPYIYQMFLVLLDYEMNIGNYDLLCSLYNLNLNEFIKNYDIEPLYLNCYYSIIEKIIYKEKDILDYFTKGLSKIIEKIDNFGENFTPINNSNNYFPILDSIYSKFTNFTPSKILYEDYDLHYGKEINLNNNTSYLQNKLQGKFSRNIRPTFHSERINNVPSNNSIFDLLIDYLMVILIKNVDLVYSMISQNTCTDEYIDQLLITFNTISSSKFYEFIMKNIILNNKAIVEKLNVVINFILNPEPYLCKSPEEIIKVLNCQVVETENSQQLKGGNFLLHNLNSLKHNLNESLNGVVNESILNEIKQYNECKEKKKNIQGNNENYNLEMKKNLIGLFFLNKDSTYYKKPISLEKSEINNSIYEFRGLIKIAMDLQKISHTIDFIIMRNESKIINEHCKKIYDSSISMNGNLTLPSENISFTNSCRNLSKLNIEDIINSDVFIEFFNEYSSIDYDYDTISLKKVKIQSPVIDKLSVFPYIAESAFSQSEENKVIDSLMINNNLSKFRFSLITNPKFSNKLNFLKSQFKTIYLFSD